MEQKFIEEKLSLYLHILAQRHLRLDCFILDEFCVIANGQQPERWGTREELTFNLGHSPNKNIPLCLFLRDVLQHIVNDRLD